MTLHSKPAAVCPGKKRRAASRNPMWNAQFMELLPGNDYLVPQIVMAVIKTEQFALIAAWRAVYSEFRDEIDRFLPDLVASFNEPLAQSGGLKLFVRAWTHWLAQPPLREGVTHGTPLAPEALLQEHIELKPKFLEGPGMSPDVAALPEGLTVPVVAQLVARASATLDEQKERLAHAVGKAQAVSLDKFLAHATQISVTLAAGAELETDATTLKFGKYTLFAMARGSCELCCLVGKGHSNPGHGGCSFEFLPGTRQLVYSRSACVCCNSALVKRWCFRHGGTESQMRVDLARNTLAPNDVRVAFFGQDGASDSHKGMEHVATQLENRALLRAMLRVMYNPTKEIRLERHDLVRLVGSESSYSVIFEGDRSLKVPPDNFYVWLRKHPCIPPNYPLQSRMELTDKQMDRALASVKRQQDEIKASVRAVANNEFVRYKQDFLDLLHNDSLMQSLTIDMVEEQLPGTLALLRFLTRGKVGCEVLTAIRGVADLCTVVTNMLTVGVQYDRVYTGLRASPWAYSYISGISAGWLVPSVKAQDDHEFALRTALEVLSASANWQDAGDVGGQEWVMAEWSNRVLAMHAFDALEWDSIVVEKNSMEVELDFVADVKTYFCGMSVAGVNVRTLYSNHYCARGIRAAAAKLMDRMGYDSSRLPDENRPPHIFLEGVARLLAFGPETRAGAMCLLSTTPSSHVLFMEDLVDAGLNNDTLGPVAEFERTRQG